MIPVGVLALGGWAMGAKFEMSPENSTIEIKVTATGSEIQGKLGKFSVKESEGSSKTLEPKKFKLTWDFKDLTTGDAVRDQNMLTWLGHEKNPEGVFELKKFVAGKEKGKAVCTGDVTINGKTQEVEFPVEVSHDGKTVTITGTCQLDYTKFDLPVIRRMMLLTVDPGIGVTFKLQGQVK